MGRFRWHDDRVDDQILRIDLGNAIQELLVGSVWQRRPKQGTTSESSDSRERTEYTSPATNRYLPASTPWCAKFSEAARTTFSPPSIPRRLASARLERSERPTAIVAGDVQYLRSREDVSVLLNDRLLAKFQSTERPPRPASLLKREYL
jgi:hypothetical protein